MEEFEKLRHKYLQLTFDTSTIDHTYAALRDIQKALYEGYSVVISSNVVVAMQAIERAIEERRGSPYYDLLLPLYQTALSELEPLLGIQKYW